MAWKVVSPSQQGRLAEDVEFIARDDPTAAERFGMALIRTKRSPRGCSAARCPVVANNRERVTFRTGLVSSFTPDAARQTVKILRFWHGARGARGRCDDTAGAAYPRDSLRLVNLHVWRGGVVSSYSIPSRCRTADPVTWQSPRAFESAAWRRGQGRARSEEQSRQGRLHHSSEPWSHSSGAG